MRRSFKESADRLDLALQGANDGLWEWDLRSDELYLCPQWRAMLGIDEQEPGGDSQQWFGRVHPDDLPRVKEEFEAHFQGRSPRFRCEFRVRHQDGVYRWMLARGMAARDRAGAPVRIAGFQTDITGSKATEELARHHAYHDPLTGLPNRALFADRVRRAAARLKRKRDALFAVLSLDLDEFKAINDSLGHDFGDELLKAVAVRLTSCVRETDSVGHLGSNHFGVVAEDLAHVYDSMTVARRLQQELAKPFAVEGQEVFLTASAGIVVGVTGEERPEDLLRDANAALNRAKARGRQACEVFDQALRSQVVRRHELQTDLRRAVERQEFLLHYQPIISLPEGTIVGLEALVRWQHPARGLVPPGEFIPLVEESGMIVPIGRWIMGEACRQMSVWKEQFPSLPNLSVHVNLSPKQLAQPDIVEQIRQVLREQRLGAGSLKVEITESALMEDSDYAEDVLRQLRTMDVDVHLDDFGTGYSSLSYLHRFPLGVLKVDRSFVMRLEAADSLRIVQTIIGLAKDMDMEVVAEGIETQAQLGLLRKLNCEYGQGYLFSAPLPPDKAEGLLQTDPRW